MAAGLAKGADDVYAIYGWSNYILCMYYFTIYFYANWGFRQDQVREYGMEDIKCLDILLHLWPIYWHGYDDSIGIFHLKGADNEYADDVR